MPYMPRNNWILIRQFESREVTTESGLVLVAGSEPPNRGEVLEVGPEAKNCKAGEIIIFARFATRIVPDELGDKMIQLMSDGDVLAIDVPLQEAIDA